MNLPPRAVEVLLTAEKQLVSLSHEATAERDYDGATALLEVARLVKMMGYGDVTAVATARPTSLALPPSSDHPASTPAISADAVKPLKRSARKNDYPRFARDGDVLVKVGWSKAERSEYEHKSPKKVLIALTEVLGTAGAKGRRFTMDKVLPLQDAADASTLPDYQCYLCLAWMRQSGFVIQHGRQGYSLPRSGDLPTAIEQRWETLPVHKWTKLGS